MPVFKGAKKIRDCESMHKIKLNFQMMGMNKGAGILITSLMIISFFSSIGFADSHTEELSFSFDFLPPTLGGQMLRNQLFTRISMPGCICIGRGVGTPSIPINFVKILIPDGYDVSNIDVTTITKDVDTSEFNLITHPIIPYQHPVPIGSTKKIDTFLNFIQSLKDFILNKLFHGNQTTSNPPFGDSIDFIINPTTFATGTIVGFDYSGTDPKIVLGAALVDSGGSTVPATLSKQVVLSGGLTNFIRIKPLCLLQN